MEFNKYLPYEMCQWLNIHGKNATNVTLIRDKNMFITQKGLIIESPYYVSKITLDEVMGKMCNGSIYANQNSLKNGYITLSGGHRVGVVGTCVKTDEKITHLRDITAINIRISREIIGSADEILPHIHSRDKIYNTLIISPPSCGKTTILRDIARQMGSYYRIGIIDERSEIAKGKNVGKYTFVMDQSGKSEGIVMMLRSMSPDVILTDEIGTESDEIALETLLDGGIKMICTAHGFNEKDVMRRVVFKNLIEKRVFEKIIILSAKNGPGTIEKIIDNR